MPDGYMHFLHFLQRTKEADVDNFINWQIHNIHLSLLTI